MHAGYTHPGVAALAGPLFAYGEKRAIGLCFLSFFKPSLRRSRREGGRAKR